MPLCLGVTGISAQALHNRLCVPLLFAGGGAAAAVTATGARWTDSNGDFDCDYFFHVMTFGGAMAQKRGAVSF